jgi:hypothetical protein
VVATLHHSVDSSTLLRPDTEQIADLLANQQVGDLLTLAPGRIAGLSGIPGSGLTRIGMSLLAPYATRGPVVYLDVRGWASPAAVWEMGIEPERLVVVRSSDVVSWGRIVATLLDGVRGVYAEVPQGLPDRLLYKLAAMARTKRTPLVLRPVTGRLPTGVAHLNLEASEVMWEGTDAGHGNLTNRRTFLTASGKATRGMVRTIEVEDDGTNDLRVVSHMGAQATRHAKGRVIAR